MLSTTYLFHNNSSSYRSREPLTDDQMRRIAPSVFAESAHESRSSRYAYIPTIEVIDGLRAEGFQPYSIAQGRTRVEGKQDFTKHMLRFRHAGQFGAQQVGDSFHEIILINSHDGTSSYQMIPGLFRLICTNGMIAGEQYEDFRVRHSGNPVEKVIEGAYRILDNIEQIDHSRELMTGINLKPAHQQIFAKAALQLRWDGEEEKSPIEPIQLLQTRRIDDRGNDLWKTFNRTQENLIKGGLSGINSKGGRTTTREVKGIYENVKLNRALWTLAEEMAKLAA